MTGSKLKLTNIITVLFIALILLNLFVLNINRKLITMGFSLILLVIYLCLFKYRKNQTENRKQVLIIMLIFGIVQIGLWYLLGLAFSFGSNEIPFNKSTILTIIIPYVVTITSSEIIRYVVSSRFERDKFFEIIITILLILIDVQLISPKIHFMTLDSFLQFIGFVLFPSISYNAVFNRLITKYGYLPNIAYRLVIVLAYYVLPIVPSVYGLFRAIGKIAIPLIMYFFIDYVFASKKFEPVYIERERGLRIGVIIACILIAIFGALISLKFKYGIIIVGSGSMTGAINYGDATFIEEVDPDTLEIGDVIVYEHEGRRIVHRIIEIGVFNNDYVFTTKGDANKNADDWHVYKNEIIGKVDFVVRYIGLPTLWLRSIFE